MSLPTRALTPFTKHPPSWPDSLPRAPSPNAITLRVRMSTVNLGGHKHFVHNNRSGGGEVWWFTPGLRSSWEGIQVIWMSTSIRHQAPDLHGTQGLGAVETERQRVGRLHTGLRKLPGVSPAHQASSRQEGLWGRNSEYQQVALFQMCSQRRSQTVVWASETHWSRSSPVHCLTRDAPLLSHPATKREALSPGEW